MTKRRSCEEKLETESEEVCVLRKKLRNSDIMKPNDDDEK